MNAIEIPPPPFFFDSIILISIIDKLINYGNKMKKLRNTFLIFYGSM